MAHPLFSFLRSFFHRISRMNWRHSCLSDYSRIFADIWPLANGWRPKYSLIVFCHADFADDADFSSWKFFVPQISQMTQIFLCGSFWSHRFHRLRRFFFVEVFLSHRFHRLHRFFFVGHFPFSGGICNDRIGRLRVNP